MTEGNRSLAAVLVFVAIWLGMAKPIGPASFFVGLALGTVVWLVTAPLTKPDPAGTRRMSMKTAALISLGIVGAGVVVVAAMAVFTR